MVQIKIRGAALGTAGTAVAVPEFSTISSVLGDDQRNSLVSEAYIPNHKEVVCLVHV